MKTLNETFSDTEFEALKQAKGKQNWHDFIMQRTNLVSVILGGGIVKVKARCPKCREQLLVNVNDLTAPEEVKTE